MNRLRLKAQEFSELLKLEHSLFALPFAFVAVFLAAEGLPSLKTTVLVILCMIFARTAGMSFNRVLDANIDRHNPRTADRAVPAGRVSPASVWVLAIFCLIGLSVCAWFLNPLAFYLSPLCHILLFSYSLTKRFTWGCHVFLGLVEAFAPLGGWIAVRGSCTHPTPYLLGLATILWFTGMDIVYATQDADYDQKKGLHSIPARFGIQKSFMLAKLCHFATVLLLAFAGRAYGTGLIYTLGIGIVALLFVVQHRLISPRQNKKLNFAFFNVNVYISMALMGFTLAEVLWRPSA